MLENLKKTDWYPLLKKEIESEYFRNIQLFIEKEKQAGSTIFPHQGQIFNAFQLTSFNQLKVVILGQDPYHSFGLAMGLCFSVNKGVKIPPSLRNVYNELFNDIGCPIPNHGNLNKWAKQGVLLLNTILTVEAGKAGSHKNIGWEKFTNSILHIINSKSQENVFLLWGNIAKEKAKLLDSNKHLILEAAHPSPLARGKFFGNRHFSRTNEYLSSTGKKPIDWCINSE